MKIASSLIARNCRTDIPNLVKDSRFGYFVPYLEETEISSVLSRMGSSKIDKDRAFTVVSANFKR